MAVAERGRMSTVGVCFVGTEEKDTRLATGGGGVDSDLAAKPTLGRSCVAFHFY